MPVPLLFILPPSACLFVWILPLAVYYLPLVTELSRIIDVYCLLMKRWRKLLDYIGRWLWQASEVPSQRRTYRYWKGHQTETLSVMGALIVSPQRKWPPGLPDHCSIHLFQKHHVYAYVLCHASKTPSSILVTVNHREWSLNVCSVDPTPSSHKMNFFLSVPPLQTLALISFMHCNIPHMQHYAKQVYYTLRDS
jgi:hypothetical protein